MDDLRCSCDFPETNHECESLLSENNSSDTTEVPSEDDSSSAAGTEGGGGVAEGGDDAEGTPTWVIVTAIAMAVLMAMMTYGAVLWRRRAVRKKAEGVDDFFS